MDSIVVIPADGTLSLAASTNTSGQVVWFVLLIVTMLLIASIINSGPRGGKKS